MKSSNEGMWHVGVRGGQDGESPGCLAQHMVLSFGRTLSFDGFSPLILTQRSSYFSKIPWIQSRARKLLPAGPGLLRQKLRHSKPFSSVQLPKLAPHLDLVLPKDGQSTEH